ncbi:MAG: glycosyltransferase family A protein, partial [Proteobacteria bacterium]|nr:glycosyltransferase family A protein [Pseudomonadota bacterium]
MSKPARRCAVITPVGDDEDGFAATEASVKAAAEYDRGGYEEIVHIRIDDPRGSMGVAQSRNLGLSRAADAGADWVAFVDSGHQLMPNAFQQVTPALMAYDAVWGAVGAFDPESQRMRLVRDTIPAFQDLPVLLHRLRDFWMGSFYFAKLSVERELPIDPDLGEYAELDHLLRLWHRFKCLKTAQIFCVSPTPPAMLSDEANRYIDQFIFDTPLFVPVRYQNRTA